MTDLTEEFKQYYDNGQLYVHYYKINNKKEGEYKEYYLNGHLYIHCFYKNDKQQEHKQYNFDGYPIIHYFCNKNQQIEGKIKMYYKNGKLYTYSSIKNNNREAKFKEYDIKGQLKKYEYYINGCLITKFNFEIEFALLKFKDIFKSKYRKPRYELLDKYFIKDISNIIGTYLFTLSNLNPNGKRILI
jgi:hypothetical protein